MVASIWRGCSARIHLPTSCDCPAPSPNPVASPLLILAPWCRLELPSAYALLAIGMGAWCKPGHSSFFLGFFKLELGDRKALFSNWNVYCGVLSLELAPWSCSHHLIENSFGFRQWRWTAEKRRDQKKSLAIVLLCYIHPHFSLDLICELINSLFLHKLLIIWVGLLKILILSMNPLKKKYICV